MWTNYGPALAAPIGAIHWASTDSATHWSAYEHEISDLPTWLETFRKFAPAREQAGVTQAEVYQPTDDRNWIVVNLRFENADAASNFRTFLIERIWAAPETSPALVGAPTARVLTEVSL